MIKWLLEWTSKLSTMTRTHRFSWSWVETKWNLHSIFLKNMIFVVIGKLVKVPWTRKTLMIELKYIKLILKSREFAPFRLSRVIQLFDPFKRRTKNRTRTAIQLSFRDNWNHWSAPCRCLRMCRRIPELWRLCNSSECRSVQIQAQTKIRKNICSLKTD